MNKNSLSHSYVKNQPLSRNDNIFIFGDLKGFKKMDAKKELHDYAEELVNQFASYDGEQYYLTLDMLPQEDQNELARWYIESVDREIEWACYGHDESINSSFLCSLLNMLKDDSKETRENFAQTTKKNILIHYENSLNELLEKSCNNHLNNTINESNYYSIQDDDNDNNNDVVWGEF